MSTPEQRQVAYDRPYDPTQLERLTQHMVDNGPVISHPLDSSSRELPNPEITSFGFSISESVTAISGIAKYFTSEQRHQRKTAKAEKLQHTINVIRVMGEMMSNPRGPSGNPNEKFGWVGINKRDLSVPPTGPWQPSGFTNLGSQLFRKQSSGSRVNEYRPTTLIERRASYLLERKQEKQRLLLTKAKWLRDSVTLEYGGESPRLNRAERQGDKAKLKQSARMEKRASRATKKFNKVTASNHISGKITKLRLNRLKAKSSSNHR